MGNYSNRPQSRKENFVAHKKIQKDYPSEYFRSMESISISCPKMKISNSIRLINVCKSE